MVGSDVIHLSGRLVEPGGPGSSCVHADLCALVDGEDHVFIVGRINPDIVEIRSAGRTCVRRPRFPRVGRPIKRRLRREKNVRVARIDDDVVKLPAADHARIVGRALPMLARVIGAKNSLRDVIVNALALGTGRDRQRDRPEISSRQARRAGFLPGVPFVGRPVNLRIGRRRQDRRSATPAASSSSAGTDCARPRVDVFRIIGIEDQPHAADFFIGQHRFPVFPAVRRSFYALVGGCGQHNVRIARIDHDGTDGASFERHQIPAPSAVIRPIEPGRSAGIYRFRTRRRHRNRADAGQMDRIADAGPHLPSIDRLPDPAARGRHVIDGRVAGHTRNHSALAAAERADQPPFEAGVKIGVDGLSEGGAGQQSQQENAERHR